MAFILADRVKETTTTTGTGAITLAGASTGFRAFSAVCANNDTVPYVIATPGGAEWEEGLGTWATGGTLTRTTVIKSSNSNNAVNFSAGSKDVFLAKLAISDAVNTSKADGRLTLTSGTPVTTSDVTGATSVFYSPYTGNEIALLEGGMWRVYRFTELTFALGTRTSGANYDLFVWNNAGTLTLGAGPAWTSDTGRGTGAGTTELEMVDGVWVNKVAITSGPAARAGRYVGTFRTTSTTTTEDSAGGTTTQVGGKRFLFNVGNRVPRQILVIDTTDNWSYTTNTIRQANAASGNKVEFVSGLLWTFIRARVAGVVFINHSTSSPAATVGIGIDSTSAYSGLNQGGFNSLNDGAGGGLYAPVSAEYGGSPGLGYHTLYWLEAGSPATSNVFLGDNGGGQQTGLVAVVEM